MPNPQDVPDIQRVGKFFTKKEWNLIWKSVLGTISVIALTMGPLLGSILKAKEEQIKLRDDQLSNLKEISSQLSKSSNTNLDATLNQLQTGLSRLGMAFPISLYDGKVSLQQGMSGKATPITDLLIQAQDLVGSKRFDAAEERLQEVDKLWPNFPGANFQRFIMLQARGAGFEKEAEAMADRVITDLTDATSVLPPIYGYSINRKLARGEKAAAERLYLKMLHDNPSETNHVGEFVRIFGYTPSLKGQK